MRATRPALALCAATLLASGIAACGGSGRRAHAVTKAAAQAARPGDGSAGAAAGAGYSAPRLKGDEDDDTVGEINNPRNPGDSDNDTDNDYAVNSRKGYYDEDDGPARAYGHASGAADQRALTALVTRYMALAAAGDGARACGMIDATFIRAIPEDYGKAPGPIYLRGKSCAVVMTKLFEHMRGQLAEKVTITGVRVDGAKAHVLFGSGRLPAGYIAAGRERGAWKIDGLLGEPLP